MTNDSLNQCSKAFEGWDSEGLAEYELAKSSWQAAWYYEKETGK